MLKNHSNKKVRLLAIFIIVFMCLPLQLAYSSDSKIGAKKIRVGWFYKKNMSELDQNGQAYGYFYEFLEEIAKRTGWQYEYVKNSDGKYLTWRQCETMLQNGELDIVYAMLYTEERAKKYELSSRDAAQASTTLFVRSDSPINQNNIKQLDGKLVAANISGMNDDYAKKFAEENGFSLNFYDSAIDSELYEAVESKKVDAGVVSAFLPSEDFRAIANFATSRAYFATQKGNKLIIDGINAAMEDIYRQNSNYARDLQIKYHQAYVSLTELVPDEVEFTKNNIIRVVYTDSWIPLCQTDKKTNKITGVVADIFSAISESTNQQFEFIHAKTDKDAISLIKNGQADIMACYDYNYLNAVKNNFLITKEYLTLPIMQVHKMSNREKTKRVGVRNIDNNFSYLGRDIEYFSYDSFDEAFFALSKNEIDTIALNSFSANYFLDRANRQDYYFSNIPFTNLYVCIAVNKDINNSRILLSILNKGIDSIDRITLNDILVCNSVMLSDISLSSIIKTYPLISIFAVMILSALIITILLFITSSRRRHLEQEKNIELNRALQTANIASKAKGDFMSRMSHEIRTPLNAIIGYTSITRANIKSLKSIHIENNNAADCLVNKIDDTLVKTESASKHLLGIINDVLDMSSIESGKFKLSNENFNLRELLSSLSLMYYTLSKDKGINFEVVINDLSKEYITGDQLRLNQILLNLLSNAIKFTSKNGKIIFTINQLKTENSKVYLEFIVSDNGIGMDKEYLGHIWNTFEQENTSIARRFGGTGLGLSITKNIVDMMNGNIIVESEKNKGSSFHVYLAFPYVKEPQNKNYDFTKIYALVVDDEANTREYMKLLLDRYKIRNNTVSNGKDAVKMIETAHNNKDDYTLCFMDWKMPEIDGIKTVKWIREIVQCDIPIIVFTAYDFSEIETEAKEAGVNMFISKPLFQSSLFDLLANISNKTVKKEITKNTEYNFSNAKALLAEDNIMNQEIAREILKSVGFIVETVKNGKEAVDKFLSSEQGSFSVILMDVQMPEMDGYEATKLIRASKHPEAKTIPILAMTANAFVEDIANSKLAGMNDHISKPIENETLFKILSKWVKNDSAT